MKRAITLFVGLILSPCLLAQGSGISVAGGIMNPGSYAFELSYFHPVVMKQLYVDVGFRHFDITHRVTDDIYGQYFSDINQMFLGARIGDYLFANPRLSWNWYGKHSSLGWGFTGGVLAPISKPLSIGLAVGYDQIRFDRSLDAFGTTKPVSITIMLTFRPL